MMKKYPLLRYLLGVHATTLAMMSVLRILFFAAVRSQLTDDVRGDVMLTATAFVRGLWFDNVVACYIMLLPLVVLSVAGIIGQKGKCVVRPVGIFLGVMYTLVWTATTANIPYFVYFTKTLNSSIWNWAGYGGTTLGMMFGETSYYLYIAAFAVWTAVFAWLLRRYGQCLRHSWEESMGSPTLRQRLILGAGSIVLVGLCLFGIRGRVGYNPIKVSAAYFCNNPILNQLGVNPMFCLLQSTLDDRRPENQRLHLMNEGEAVREVQAYLSRKGMEGISPIAREVKPGGEATGQNVVVILMESMSANLTGYMGSTTLTPHLDALAREGHSFTNCYSAGNHTNHGLYATLYSFPSILKRNAMKGSAIPRYDGLASVLHEAGYQTLFFMTHETQYDNMNAFLLTNGYDEVYGQEDYPRERIANHFGVPDDYLFEYALPVLRERAAAGKPFLATLLTISNHPPYVMPDASVFSPRSSVPEEGIVEYADWCIGRFMGAASKEAWYDNTIFVLLGDHGKMVGQADCELPASYNHIPLIIYGRGVEPCEDKRWAGQVDVAPTILGMLRQSYTQNNFGIDLLREERPCIFYSADNTVAARDEQHLYVYNPDAEREFCYALEPDQAPQPSEMSEAHKALRSYVFAMLQSTEAIVREGKTRMQ